MLKKMTDYDSSSDDNIKTSKLNSGQLTNFALHDLFLDFFKSYTKGDLLNANLHLDCIWIILGGDEEKDSDKVKEYEKYSSELGKLGSLRKKVINTFNKQNDNDDYNNIRTKQIEALKSKAVFLRRLLNKQGKGTAYAESLDEYMD